MNLDSRNVAFRKNPIEGARTEIVPQPLGLTIMSEDIAPQEAVRLGVKEGIADTSKFLTIGIAVMGLYLILPDKWLRRVRREVKKVL